MVWPLLAAFALLWRGAAGDGGLICRDEDVSFFRASVCADGMIGDGSKCACSDGQAGGCPLSGRREYLPPRALVEEVYYNKRVMYCDRVFRLALSKHLLTTRNVTKHTGYPQDCTKPNECHKPSLGKYIRYNSLMQFHAFGGRPGEKLYDFTYPFGFRWAQGLCEADLAGTWDCGFKPTSKLLDEHANSLHALLAKLEKSSSSPDDVHEKTEKFVACVGEKVDAARQGRKNHVAQLLLYARLTYLLSRPSNAVDKYLSSHTVTLNPLIALSYFKERFSANMTFQDLNEHGGGTFHRQPPSVSMHVRQGDSCDKMLNHSVPNMVNYLEKRPENENHGQSLRPCFSVDVYMEALRSIRSRYGSLRVYLSTDSKEMIARAHKETSFTWVFVNSSRAVYNDRESLGIYKYIDYLNSNANEVVLFGGLADLALLSRGDIFLGAFSSHFSKVAYYSMVGQHLRVLPFVSLDYPLDCDTTDSCTPQDLEARHPTMEDLATWAPECLRGKLPWSPGENSDPCGVYI